MASLYTQQKHWKVWQKSFSLLPTGEVESLRVLVLTANGLGWHPRLSMARHNTRKMREKFWPSSAVQAKSFRASSQQGQPGGQEAPQPSHSLLTKGLRTGMNIFIHLLCIY